jgi:alpha-beta hydrolase superfamily lysophospholipase
VIITEKYRAEKGGVKIFTRTWQPEGKLRGVVTLVHGLGEHCGRYAHVAETFCRAGYALLGFDLRGHGLSDGQRGHIPSTALVMDDIQAALDESAACFPGFPQFLYGHSLGGSLVLAFALERQPHLNGLIVSAPVLGPGEPVPIWKALLASCMDRLAPSFSMNNGLNTGNLSHDSEVVSAYRTDPLVHARVSARLGMFIINNGKDAIINAHHLNLPLLLMQGTADRIVSLEATQDFASSCEGHVTLILWEGLYHEIHNEPQKADVLAEMLRWMDDRQTMPTCP